MACSGAHCTNHNTGTTTCSGHRSSCSTNRPLSLSSDFGVEGKRIRASDVNNLRINLRNELARWNQHANYNFTLREGSSITVGKTITEDDVDNLNQMAIDVKGGTNINKQPGDLIDDVDWIANIRDLYNDFRNDCICNSDCSCNAVCSCHNDCGCHYTSDKRLKTNIRYM